MIGVIENGILYEIHDVNQFISNLMVFHDTPHSFKFQKSLSQQDFRKEISRDIYRY